MTEIMNLWFAQFLLVFKKVYCFIQPPTVTISYIHTHIYVIMAFTFWNEYSKLVRTFLLGTFLFFSRGEKGNSFQDSLAAKVYMCTK